MDVFRMSLSASLLIVAIVMVRAVALHRLPKETFLALWGVAVFRLLVPFSVPSRLSVYTGLNGLRSLLAEKAAAPSPAGIAAFPVSAAPMMHGAESIGAGAPTASMPALTIVWLAGIGLCASFFLIAYLKCRREFQMSLPVESDFVARWLREHPLRRSMRIRHTDRVKAPLTYGVFGPVILLPRETDWEDEKRLRYILAHEYVHIRRLDTLAKLVLTAAVCVHWFNPLVWVMYALANRDMELSCDEAVVRTFGESMKSAYALTLIGLEVKKGRPTPLVNHFSKNAMEERIVSIMKTKKCHVLTLLLAVALVSGMTAVFATAAPRSDKAEQENRKDMADAMAGEAAARTQGHDRANNMADAMVDDGEIAWANRFIDKILAHFGLTGSQTQDITGTVAAAVEKAGKASLYEYAKAHILDGNMEDDIRMILRYESFEFIPALSAILRESSHDARGQIVAAVYREYANSIKEDHPADFEIMAGNLERWNAQ